MTLQTPVHVSTSPDDGQGDKLRDAFIKINERFKDVETAQAAGISEIYQGARLVDPTVRGDLTPLQEGDFYFNTALETPSFKVYIDGVWVVAPDIMAAALAAATGSSLVGFQPAGTGAAPTTVQARLREHDAALSNVEGNLNFTTLSDALTPVADTDLLLLRQGTQNKKLSASVFRAEFAADAEAAEAGAIAARDAAATLVSSWATSVVPEYASVADGVAAVADGSRFFVPTPSGFRHEYVRAGADAKFLQSIPLGSAANIAQSILTGAATVIPRPEYEWIMAGLRKYDGRVVPNTGTRGSHGDPVFNALAGWTLALDADNAYTHAKVINDPDVVDPLGNLESSALTFTATTQRQGFVFRGDIPNHPVSTLRVSVWVRTKGATHAELILGSSSDATGAKTNFTSTDTWTKYEVEIPSYSAASLFEINLRPAAGATLPCSISVYAPMVRDPQSGAEPTLSELRNAALAGHAYASFATSNAAQADPQGGFIRGPRITNVLAPLTQGSPLSQQAMSCWIKSDQLPAVIATFAVSFANTETVSTNIHERGRLGVVGGSATINVQGRLRFDPGSASGGNMDAKEYTPCIGKSGWTHIHINAGYVSTDSPTPAGLVACEVLVNGCPMFEQFYTSVAAWQPKAITLGDFVQTSRMAAHRNAIGLDSVECVRYWPGQRISRDEVLAQVMSDRTRLPALTQPLDVMMMFEGDSTEQFSGSPSFGVSNFLEKKGRLFLNHARPGSWYQGGIASNSDYIGTNLRRALRLTSLSSAIAQGYKKVMTVWRPGENDQNANAVWAVAANKTAGLQTLTDFILDDLEAVDPGRGRTVSIFSTMKQSYWSSLGLFANVEDIWAAVDAIYTEQVDPINAPYLYRAPSNYVGRKHDYVIKLHLWAPNDGVTAFADWRACALDAGGVTHATIADAQANAITGAGTRWHSTPGWVRITSNPSGSQFYKRRATEPASPNKFSVSHLGSTTLWYEQVTGTAAPANGVISSDGQHWTSPWSPFVAESVYGPSILRVFELEGVS
jgi:hypothetical protein